MAGRSATIASSRRSDAAAWETCIARTIRRLAKLFTPPDDASETTIVADDSVTAEGKVLGTVAYMSPEQAEGKALDHRSDIFSLGVVLYEMATGKRPFAGDTPISTISAILKDTPTPVTGIKTTLPRHPGRVVGRCMEKNPDKRFQTARDVCNELEGLQKEVESGEIELTTGTISRETVGRAGQDHPRRRQVARAQRRLVSGREARHLHTRHRHGRSLHPRRGVFEVALQRSGHPVTAPAFPIAVRAGIPGGA